MPSQTTQDFGSRLTWPLAFVPRHKGRIPTATSGIFNDDVSLLLKATFTNASTIDTDGISASHAGAGSAGTTSMTLGGALCSGGVATLTPPRNVVITVTHSSSIIAMSGTITGTDIYGRTVTEAWAVTATGTSKTFTGKVAFKTVTSITEVVGADASSNTIVAGDGKVLGLSFKAAVPIIVAETEDGAAPTAGVLVAASTTANTDYRGTYTPNSTLDGTQEFVVYYICDDPVAVQP